MKKSVIFFIVLCALFTACDQEPLFWDIANEIPPIEPLIKGSPSNIVSVVESGANPVLYVSNGTIWTWDTNTSVDPAWQKMPTQPGGKIKTLAAAGSFLFSLDWDGNIQKWDGTAWSPVTGTAGKPEKIFGAGSYVFAGSLTGTAGSPGGYCILAMDAAGSSMNSIKNNTGLLSGAAERSGNYYLGTMGDGIYKTSTPGADLGTPDYGAPTSDKRGVIIIGLINHGPNIVVAVTTNSLVYDDGSGFTLFASYPNSFSGALASWENEDGDRLLLLGLYRNSGSFGYGYRELIWERGIKDFKDSNQFLYIPGETRPYYISEENILSSVKQDYHYTSGISNHVVLALYVLPHSFATKADEAGRPIVYASTHKDGFWAYRTRRDATQWNGEDNSN